MEKLWEHHFKYYDLFQNNFDKYKATIDFHLNKLRKYHRILDTGAGTGNLTLELLKKGHKVVAVDSNSLSLSILKKKCDKYSENLTVNKINVEKLDFNGGFDGVSSMFVIPFVKDNKKYFSGVYKALKINGIFTISAWAPLSDSWLKLKAVVEKEMKKKGFLPKYQKEFDHISESSEVNGRIVSEGRNIKEIKELLIEIGFLDIEEFSENIYNKYAYFLTCKKK